jgi:predicted HTH transcriptional regulator
MRYAEGKASRPEGMGTENMPLQDCLPLKFWENYSAFANSGGGSIRVINKGGFDSDSDEAMAEIRKGLFDRSVVSSNILMGSDIVKTPDGFLVKVPSAERRVRPVFIGDSCETGTFVRSEGKTVRCCPESIRSMIRDSIDPGSDTEPTCLDISIIRTDSVKAFRKSVKSKGHIWEGRSDDEFLSLTSSAADSNGWLRPTNAGVVLFSDYYTASSAFPGYRLRYRDDEKYLDSEDGRWTGNIADYYMEVSDTIDIHLPEISGPAKELIINALAHSDLNFGDGVSVELTEGKLTICNSGIFRAGQEQSLKGAKDRRNPAVAKLLGLVSPCRGLGRALSEIDAAGYEAVIEEDHRYGTVKVSVFGRGAPRAERGPVAERILEAISRDRNVTVGQLSEMMGLSRRQVERHISDLKSDGSLVRTGSRRSGSWKVL